MHDDDGAGGPRRRSFAGTIRGGRTAPVTAETGYQIPRPSDGVLPERVIPFVHRGRRPGAVASLESEARRTMTSGEC